MASRMRVTSLMDEARCYEALPITAKTIGHRTKDGTLDGRALRGSQFRLIGRTVRHTRSVHTLELKIPPVALVIGVAVLMWVAAAYSPGLNVKFPFQPVVAWAFGLWGVITCVLGVVAFKRAKT